MQEDIEAMVALARQEAQETARILANQRAVWYG